MSKFVGKEPEEVPPVGTLETTKTKRKAEIEAERENEEKETEEEITQLSIDEMIVAGWIGPKIIDGIHFYLLGMIKGSYGKNPIFAQDGTKYNNYTKVAILSGTPSGVESGDPNNIENKNLFWVYPSQSELGMWRLCYAYTLNPGHMLDKLTHIPGNPPETGDYVQTTLIHIELQKFINENEHEIVVYNVPGGALYDQITRTRNPYRLPYLHFANGDVITCPVFDLVIDADANPVNREIKIDIAPFNIMNPVDIKTKPKLKCGAQFPKYKLNKEEMESNKTEEQKKLVIERETEILQEKRRKFLQATLISFSASLYEHYDIYENEIIYPNYSSSIIDTDLSVNTVIGTIYSVTLKAKEIKRESLPEELREIKIIYLRTTGFIGFERYPPPKLNYYMTITMIPSSAVCNKYGLYSRYIYAGTYICKLVDYKVQCTLNEAKEKSCTDTYSFIGDRYDTQLFPYVQIQEILSPQEPQESTPRFDATPETTPRYNEKGEQLTQPFPGGSSRRTRRRKSKRRKTRMVKRRKTHKKSHRKTRRRTRGRR